MSENMIKGYKGCLIYRGKQYKVFTAMCEKRYLDDILLRKAKEDKSKGVRI
jgi:hypothetical protein